MYIILGRGDNNSASTSGTTSAPRKSGDRAMHTPNCRLNVENTKGRSKTYRLSHLQTPFWLYECTIGQICNHMHSWIKSAALPSHNVEGSNMATSAVLSKFGVCGIDGLKIRRGKYHH